MSQTAWILILRCRRQRGKIFSVVTDNGELSRFFGHNLAKSETAVNLFTDVADIAEICSDMSQTEHNNIERCLQHRRISFTAVRCSAK
jgi:hypothetical protein